jgi:hypothetical protein
VVASAKLSFVGAVASADAGIAPTSAAIVTRTLTRIRLGRVRAVTRFPC